MKLKSRLILLFLTACMLLSACGGNAENTAIETAAPTAAPTEAPAETEATEPVEVSKVAETVLPTGDEATGTLIFYINDQKVYAGGPVANLITAGVHSYDDLEAVVQPWEMSELIRVRIILEDVEEDDEPLMYFVAVNASDEPKPVSECLFYSLTVNCDKGIQFGSGNETTPFVTGETTRDEIVEAYGEPTESSTYYTLYEEIVYYKPFSCAYFTFYRGTLRQVYTYYSANIYGTQAEEFPYELTGSYFGADCYILMNQYLDVEKYLPAAEEEETQEKAAEETAEETEEDTTGILASLTESIQLDGKTIEFGVRCVDMPKPFGEGFKELLMPLSRHYYVRTGIVNEEEFYFINENGQSNQYADELLVKGVITENCNYTNWGTDNRVFHTFAYENLNQDSTIDDIIGQYGMPREMHCSSNARVCFAWLYYEAENGNELQLRVDPMTNQLVEIRVIKYFEGERAYQ